MYVDPKSRTTATLFGNDTAMRAVQLRGADGESVLSGGRRAGTRHVGPTRRPALVWGTHSGCAAVGGVRQGRGSGTAKQLSGFCWFGAQRESSRGEHGRGTNAPHAGPCSRAVTLIALAFASARISDGMRFFWRIGRRFCPPRFVLPYAHSLQTCMLIAFQVAICQGSAAHGVRTMDVRGTGI